MKINKTFLIGIFAIVVATALVSSAVYSVSNPQLTSTNYNYGTSVALNSLNTNKDVCEKGQDFVLQVSPLGCSPTIVRSDLLEEQNVPVFCSISATQVNPLIKVDAIKYMTFTGKLPEEVSGVGFHPAQAAIDATGTTLLNSPILENIGYAVIVLKEQKNESSMPDFVSGTLTANIKYDIENTFGVGKAVFYIPELTQEEWANKFSQYGFWRGKGYLKVDSIGDNSATLSLYSNKETRLISTTLDSGKTSSEINLLGFYCLAGVQLKLDGLESPKTRARFEINGEIVEVSEGESFADNKCSVTNLDKRGLAQLVTFKCSTDSGAQTTQLSINPMVTLEIEGAKKDYKVGDYLYTDGDKSVYLAYIGTKQDSTNLNDVYVFLMSKPIKDENGLSDSELKRVADFDRLTRGSDFSMGVVNLASDFAKRIFAGLQQIFTFLGKGESFIKIPYTTNSYALNQISEYAGKDFKIVDFSSPVDAELDSNVKQNYDNAMSDYRTIIESYPNTEETITNSSETSILTEKTFGEQAFFNAIQLADETGQKKSMLVLCDEFKEKFPNSETKISECDDSYRNSNQEKSVKSVSINSEVKKISFKGIYEPSIEDFSAVVNVRNASGNVKPYTLTSGSQIYLSDNSNEYIELMSLTQDTATVRINVPSSTVSGAVKQAITSSDITLKKNEGASKGDYVFTLTDIQLKRIAKVSVIPNIENAGTTANFSFNIGIEKRAIQLAPDEVEAKIKDLDNLIEDWSKISNDLGNTIKTFNTACLSTGVLLTVKNFFDNSGGKSIARDKVMRSDGGWVDLCREAVSTKKLNGKSVDYSNINDCLLDNNNALEKDVDTVYNSLKDVSITEDNKNTESKLIAEGLKENTITNPTNSKETLDISAVKTMLNYDGADNTISYSDLRDLKTIQNALNNNPSEELKKVLLQEQYKLLSDINANVEAKVNEKSILDEVTQTSAFSNAKNIASYSSKDTTAAVYNGLKTNADVGEIKSGTPYQIFSYNNKIYVAVLQKSSGNNYVVTGVYDRSGVSLDTKVNKDAEKIQNSFTFKEYSSTSYENKFKDAEVKYFETVPYKGMPALVPFDLNNGWYVAMKQTVSSGALNTYTDAGAVSSFYLCNVGANGKAEFTSTARDDECRLYTPGTGRVVSAFPNIDDNTADKLVSCAINAVSSAAKAYKSGVTRVNIQTSCGGTVTLGVGNPEVGVPEIQCQDFMSPQDCSLLFNVCDPVVCPSSRCNLGGTYYVDNVVASGIIGSIALCLPNFREHILVPVCLTGLKAGIDQLVSLFDATRSCLQTQLDSGESVGVCDEIESIYLCQFFWEQALPLTENLIPKIFASLLGQEGTRGGGEYLGVQSAWDTAQSSVDYLSQYYGRDIASAFKVKVTEEVGGAVCKNFISANYPSSGEVLDSLVEPESPPQFTASFEETTFTTATVPPTSHYKVYYHIYAGEESKVYYRVYLKTPSGTSLYATNPTLTVDSGFIAAGEYVDKSPDFTATTGYQELCVSINGGENCGFKKVTSDFALNYISDAYAAEQAAQTIETSEECVSGTPSAYSLVQLNLQSAIEDITNPSIYELGITRVCSSENPGKNTDANINNESARWQPVGTCDDGLTCYLDTQSVKDVIKSTELEGEALGEIKTNYINTILKEGNYLDFVKEINTIKKLNDKGKTDYITNTLIGKAFFNYQKAKLYLIRGDAYANLVDFAIFMTLADNYGTTTTMKQSNNLDSAFKDCVGQYGGQCDAAKEIVKLAGEIKSEKSINDDIVEKDTGANCFEELVLMLAMQETGVKHCNGDFSNDLTCDGDASKVLKGDDGISIGVMQVNTKANPDATNMEDFDSNVKYGINHLIENYNTESKRYDCRQTYYGGWQRALRYYNGWNTDCNTGNINYVDEVLDKKSLVEKYFGNVCGTETSLIEESPTFEFADGAITVANIYYRYNNLEWQWSYEGDYWYSSSNTDVPRYTSGTLQLSDLNKNFITKLSDAYYEEGFKLLMQRTDTNNEGLTNAELVTDKVTYTNNQIIIPNPFDMFKEPSFLGKVYFRISGDVWQFSDDSGSSWQRVANLDENKLSSEGKIFVKNLQSQNLYEAAFNAFEIFNLGKVVHTYAVDTSVTTSEETGTAVTTILWTFETALKQTDVLIQTYGEETSYGDEDKVDEFVDELCSQNFFGSDGGDDCKNIRGQVTFFIRFGEKNLGEIKGLLEAKQRVDLIS